MSQVAPNNSYSLTDFPLLGDSDFSYVLASVGILICTISFLLLHHRFAIKDASDDTSKIVSDGPLSSASPRRVMDLKEYNFSNVQITKILVHPIKSCRGTSVEESEYSEQGLKHDRKFAIVDANTHKVITARDVSTMVLIHPQIIRDGNDESKEMLTITFPIESDCEPFTVLLSPDEETLKTWRRIDDIKLWGREDIDGHVCQTVEDVQGNVPSKVISSFIGRDVLLVMKGDRARPCPTTFEFPQLQATTLYQDGYPLLVASEESLVSVQDRMRQELGKQCVADRWREDDLVMERFRPNIVLGGVDKPWAEDFWETIQVGSNDSSISLVSKCTRCLLPNVDPESGVRDKAVPYKILMKFRTGKDPARMSKPCFGLNGVPSGTGVIHVGDAVKVLKLAKSTALDVL